MYKALNKKLEDTGSDRPLNAIFHCAQSQQRGPAAAMKLLRFLPDDKLSNFKIWVLRGGFNHWQDQYGEDQELTEDYEPDIWSW